MRLGRDSTGEQAPRVSSRRSSSRDCGSCINSLCFARCSSLKGAHVIAVASGKHEQLLRELGADEFIDYTKSPPEDVVHDVDLVVDALGGPSASRFLRTLKPGGALFLVFPLGFAGGEDAEKLRITVSSTQVRSSGAQLAEVGRLLEDGAIRVVLDSIYPLAAARSAHERAAQGHIQGKIVLGVK
ncbi:zinc-binding dehydrogenase [Sphingomonas sp. PB4P5]|uniref:zinc-binding dehydrogenase n=1 Tax=Parasphingomonas puruogangriensis TaxID=3096155 RepID=UPI002FC87435